MLVRKKMKKWASARQKSPRGCICGTWSLRCKDCVTSIWVYLSVLASFHYKYSIQNTIDTQRMIQVLQKYCTSQGKVTLRKCCSRVWKGRLLTRQQDTGKLAKNIKIICLQTPIWKVSCHRSIISGLLGNLMGNSRVFQWFAQKAS